MIRHLFGAETGCVADHDAVPGGSGEIHRVHSHAAFHDGNTLRKTVDDPGGQRRFGAFRQDNNCAAAGRNDVVLCVGFDKYEHTARGIDPFLNVGVVAGLRLIRAVYIDDFGTRRHDMSLKRNLIL